MFWLTLETHKYTNVMNGDTKSRNCGKKQHCSINIVCYLFLHTWVNKIEQGVGIYLLTCRKDNHLKFIGYSF